jgi:hypothetical protein
VVTDSTGVPGGFFLVTLSGFACAPRASAADVASLLGRRARAFDQPHLPRRRRSRARARGRRGACVAQRRRLRGRARRGRGARRRAHHLRRRQRLRRGPRPARAEPARPERHLLRRRRTARRAGVPRRRRRARPRGRRHDHRLPRHAPPPVAPARRPRPRRGARRVAQGPRGRRRAPRHRGGVSLRRSLRQSGYEQVYTSDTGMATPDRWLQVRNTVCRGDGGDLLERIVSSERSRGHALRRRAKLAAKRWR